MPDVNTVLDLLRRLDVGPEEFVRQVSDHVQNAVPEDLDEWSLEQWAEFIHDTPDALQRPVIVSGETGEIARPPEPVVERLSGDQKGSVQ